MEEKLLKIFKGFINDLIKVFPEHKESLETNYKDILELDNLVIDDNEIIKEFLKMVDNISDDITNKNDEVFTDDLYLIKDISMKTIWSSDISNKTRESIWKYLQSICLINITINSNDKINEVLKSLESNEKVKDKKTVKEMKKMKKINENLQKQEQNNTEVPENMENLLENTSIGNLAKEITEGLNIDEGNAEDLLKPENMMNIFQTINTTLNDKINNKEIDMNNLFGEASGLMNNDMMGNMMGMFGNMMGKSNTGNGQAPDMSNMMDMMGNIMGQSSGPVGPDMANMMQQMQQGQATQPSPQQKSKGNHDPNVVRERLKKKLESKK